jgi:3-hydroxyisobutyrate dehydrogenase-like beta-hydroxyacid dehydrogenase
MKVAFLGAGKMGLPMIERVRDGAHDVSVLVRRATAEIAGVRRCESVAETVAHAEVVVCVVQTDAQVQQVCLGAAGALAAMQPGAALVQHTTCDPATLELLTETAERRALNVLDAALSGGPHDIAAGSLTLWVGGERGLLEALRPLLSLYADPITFVGEVGHGQRVKLVNNALFVAQVGLAIDAVRLAAALGIAESTILAALPQGSAQSRALSVVARGGSVDHVAKRLAPLMRKDVDVVREVARRLGADLGVLGSVLASTAVEEKVLGGHA